MPRNSPEVTGQVEVNRGRDVIKDSHTWMGWDEGSLKSLLSPGTSCFTASLRVT